MGLQRAGHNLATEQQQQNEEGSYSVYLDFISGPDKAHC